MPPGMNSPELRLAGDLPGALRVLPAGADTQIALSIVDAVPIDMIDHHAFGRFHDFAVHKQQAAFARAACVIEAVATGPPRVPLVATQPRVVDRIHNGE